MTVPYTFATATSAIPLSQLDSNFATAITLGSTALYLGNTTTTIAGLTLTSPTLTTPALGTPASGVLTNCTGLPAGSITGTLGVANGGTGVTTSTGTGNVVLSTSPTLVTPVLGTPTSVTLTNGTGLPLSTGVTGTLGTTNGGTGLTSFTANGVVYASSSSALSTGSALTFDGTNLGVGGSSAGAKLSVNKGASGAILRLTDGSQQSMDISSNAGAGAAGVITSDTLNSGAQAWAIASSEQMRLTSTGLGIGTSSPAYKLDVVGEVKIKAASGYNFLFQNSGTTARINYLNDAFSANVSAAYRATDFAWQKGDGSPVLNLDSAGNLGLGVTPSAWDTTGGQRAFQLKDYVTLWQGGNGSSNLAFNTYEYAGNAYKYLASSYASKYTQLAGEHRWFNAPSGTGGDPITFTQAMTLDASGNLGIGTTSPTQRQHLAIATATAIYSRIQNSAGDCYLGLDASGNTNLSADNVGNQLIFKTVATERARIDSSGNLLVGYTTAYDKLQVAGSISSQGGGYVGFYRNGPTNNTNVLDGVTTTAFGISSGVATGRSDASTWVAGFDSLRLVTQGTERARIDTSGNLLVGTTSAPANRLYVQATRTDSNRTAIIDNNGNTSGNQCLGLTLGTNTTNTSSYFLVANGAGADRMYIYGNGNIVNSNNSYGALSDIKLKENIVDATPKLAGLMQVKVRNYNLIGDTIKQIGVVAQELETVFPAMIDETPDRDAEGNDLGTTTKSVKYSVFVPMLIKAMQEQQALIESLTKRLADAGI